MATRWGCLGPGKISWDFFLAIKENLPETDHEFVAVASRDLTRSKKFAEDLKFTRAYGSYDEMATDKDVEVVYIGTINTNHMELSIKMLKAGKHVICEKPMGMNYNQVKQVLDVAKEQNLFFTEALWTRWLPAFIHIQKELSEGTLGDPRLAQANFCVPIAAVERVKNVKFGGGGLLDIGVYVVQFACFVYKEMPKSITAVGNMMGEVDENACILLKYENGAMANLTYHTNAGIGNNTACIQGTKGRADVIHPFHASTEIKTPSGSYNFPLKDGNYYFENSAALQYEAAAVRDCIKKGLKESSNYTHADSEMVHKIMDEVRRQLGVKYPDCD